MATLAAITPGVQFGHVAIGTALFITAGPSARRPAPPALLIATTILTLFAVASALVMSPSDRNAPLSWISLVAMVVILPRVAMCGQQLTAVTLRLARIRSNQHAQLRAQRQSERQGRLYHKQQLREQRELVGYKTLACHDLRAPIEELKRVAERLVAEVAEGDPDRSAGQRADELHASASRSLHLFEAIRRYEKAQSQPLERQPCSLRELVGQAQAAAAGAGLLSMSVQLDPTLNVINVDRTLMTQALTELFANAVRYRGRRSQATVHMQGRVQGDSLQLQIADNGIGLDPQQGPRMFEVFARGDPNSDTAGVGLSLVQRIVSRHGGTATAVGKEGAGCVVTLTLPLVPNLVSRTPQVSRPNTRSAFWQREAA